MKKLKRLSYKFAVRKRVLLTLPLAAFVCTTTIYAQAESDASAKSAPPTGPLLATAADMSQWTITYTYPGDQNAKMSGPVDTSKPRTIVTIKTGDIIHEETTTVGGAKTESWQVHGDYFIKFPGKNYWSAYEKSSATAQGAEARTAMILPDSGFRGLDWIKKDAYAGKITTSAGENLVFVPGGMKVVNAANSNAQQKLDSLPTIAYINTETRLPVMARAPGETRQYTFNQPGPSSTQVLPDDLLAEIKQGEAIRAKREGAPAAEY